MCRNPRFSFALLLGLAALPAAGDWLQTKDGALLETSGPWTLRRNLVVFERPDGTLASLQLRDVDLEGSRAATREAGEALAPPADPPAAATAVLSLTMKDIPKAVPETEESAEEAADEPIRLTSWTPASKPAPAKTKCPEKE